MAQGQVRRAWVPQVRQGVRLLEEQAARVLPASPMARAAREEHSAQRVAAARVLLQS